jgi:transposase InsO family protein
LDETWQADLVEMIPYSRENNGYNYLLTVIDIFSKYAWARPIKRKSGDDVTAAMKSIFQDGRIPKTLHTDRGKEFYNSTFESLMKKCDINLYSTYSNLKASTHKVRHATRNKTWPQFTQTFDANLMVDACSNA